MSFTTCTSEKKYKLRRKLLFQFKFNLLCLEKLLTSVYNEINTYKATIKQIHVAEYVNVQRKTLKAIFTISCK